VKISITKKNYLRNNHIFVNSGLLVIGIVSLSLLLIIGVIQSSTAQRYDDDDNHHDKDKWKGNRHDDDNHHHNNHDNFELTVRLITDKDRHIPDLKVKVSGETKYMDGKRLENDDKANVKFYLHDADNKERVCITNERNDNKVCKGFDTDGTGGTVKFYIS